MNSLKIYRASAGSGKTFQLSKEYIELLFAHPQSYKHILAVTFTNKATEEMKGRILEELFALAQDKKSAYKASLMQKFKRSEKSIQQEAKDILNSILHDYSRFTITTIDRFFQQVVRSLVRELGLYGSYQIELDSDLLLQEALMGMMEELDKPNSDQLKEWLMRFSENKIEGQQGWSLNRDILNLGKEIFKETYRTIDPDDKKRFTDKLFLKNYQQKLKNYKHAFEKSLQVHGEKALKEMVQWGLNKEDFSGKSLSPVGIFSNWVGERIKAPTSKQLNWQNNLELWYTKGSKSITQIEQAYPILNECLVEGIAFYTKHAVIYNSIEAALKNFYTLGLLSDLAAHAQEYSRENNTMLLSDTSQLLRGIINDSDIPFVYEKIGSYIHHFMIDEFQDTSMMQWLNFEPLLRNSLASGNESLIVGDVKQSIYRWRNSEWTLLSEQVEKTFSNCAQVYNLEYNWRSSEQVVHFNNAFFARAPQILQETLNNAIEASVVESATHLQLKSKIINAYQGQFQQLPEGKRNNRGYVRFEQVITPEKAKKEEVQGLMVERIAEVIEDLAARNYQWRDMAVLVRSNSEGLLVANQLLKNNYPFVSDDALRVSSSSLVQFLVCLLKVLDNSTDLENIILLASLYLTLVEGKTKNEAMDHIAQQNDEYLRELLFMGEKNKSALKKLHQASLYEVTAQLIYLFNLQQKHQEAVFIQSFLDLVWEYSMGRSRSIASFLTWWKERGQDKKLPGGEIPNAIRILTIHKSKGLEYKAIIVPFATWELENTHANTLWCKPSKAPLNELPLLPIPSNKDLANTIFADDYYQEKVQSYVDNLNLAYVAFTRAIDELYVFTHLEGKGEITHLSNLLLQCFSEWKVNNPIYELGNKIEAPQQVLDPKQEDVLKEMRFKFPHDRLRLFYRSSDFFTNNEEINYGHLMHLVFSKIQKVQQSVSVVEEMIGEGILSEKDAKTFSLKLQNMLQQNQIKEWFSDQYQIINERAILLPNGHTLRPDRVLIREQEAIVIDYKFGLQQHSSYTLQVKNYMQQLQTMGYTSVQGFLWYFELNEIVPIHL